MASTSIENKNISNIESGNDKSCGKRKASDETESRDVEPSKELKPDETFSKEGGDNKEITKKEDEQQKGHGAIVAAHYNTLEEKGLEERAKSRIFYLRNFNNWVKSMLINEFMEKLEDKSERHGRRKYVLDIGCGKGGDLLKWRRAKISHLICTDLAETSIEQCKSRYEDLKHRSKWERYNDGPVFTAEFIPADSTKKHLLTQYKNPAIELDLVSSQFVFHYSFESFPQAECMLRNAAECLREGGYFIGTIPDAYEIVRRLKESKSKSFGNDIYSIEFEKEVENLNELPLFGAKYQFHLEGVVDCPEFLVHFPTLIKLASRHHLKLVLRERFEDFFERWKDEGRSLLGKMQCLETFPPWDNTTLNGDENKDYKHVHQFKEKSSSNKCVGTMSKSEWEAASLYMVFAFQKVKKT